MRTRRAKEGHLTPSTSNSVKDTAETLLGREQEVQGIVSRVEHCVTTRASASLYLSGPPGTGKTAAVNTALRLVKHRVVVVKLNCVSVNTEPALLRALREQLPSPPSCKSNRSSVEQWLANNDRCVLVLVLDELDYIHTKHRAVLYTAFRWPSLYTALFVIAISNSFDLTQRELPKLKLEHAPELMPFSPYSTAALTRILTRRLSQGIHTDIRGIELCARKVAAMTGDVRQALDIATNMLPSLNPASDQEPSCSSVLGAITNVYRCPLDKAVIPLQQKVLLATLLRLVNQHNTTIIHKDELFGVLERVCDALSLSLSDVGGAQVALSLLESLSLVSCTPRSCQLLVDIPTVISFIADSALLANIDSLPIQ